VVAASSRAATCSVCACAGGTAPAWAAVEELAMKIVAITAHQLPAFQGRLDDIRVITFGKDTRRRLRQGIAPNVP
jgi:hypothetical protein